MAMRRAIALTVAVVWLLAIAVMAQGAVTVTVADVSGPHGEDVEIPVEVRGAAGVGAMHLELTYDASVLSVREVQAGDLVGGGLVVGNTATAGQVTISIAHANGFSGDGTVARIIAHVRGDDGATSPLNLRNITANHAQTKSAIPTTTTNGTFTEGGGAKGSLAIWIVLGFMGLVLLGALLYAFTRRSAGGRSAARGGVATLGLAVVSGSAAPAFLPLDQPVTTIGRSASNRLVLDDERASREHARIVSSGDAHILYDLGSTHGTLVNGVQVTQQGLKVGDQITIGSTTLVVR